MSKAPVQEVATKPVRWIGETYRAAYTVRFADVVYVLPAFHKRSRKGIETPKSDVDLIKARLIRAREDYAQWRKSQRS